MKRIMMVLSVAALMATMMVGSALPAFAVPCGSFGDLPADACANVLDPNFWAQNAPPLRHGEAADVIGQNAQQNLPGTVDVIGQDAQQNTAGTVDVLGPDAPAWVT